MARHDRGRRRVERLYLDHPHAHEHAIASACFVRMIGVDVVVGGGSGRRLRVDVRVVMRVSGFFDR